MLSVSLWLSPFLGSGHAGLGAVQENEPVRRKATNVRYSPRRAILAQIIIALVASLVGGCRGPRNEEPIRVVVREDDGGSGPASSADVAELARREGELYWYTSLPEEAAAAFLALFRGKHPYVTTHLVRASTFDTIQTVQTQIESGRVQADVLHVLDVAIFVKLKKQGQLLRYTSCEERFIPAKYKDPGFWSALRCVDLCIAYDSARLKPEDAPRTWLDLQDPRWSGRIALKDAQTAGSAYAQYYFLREEYGAHYWRRIAGQRPHIYKTAQEGLRALEAGEVAVFSGAMGYSIHEAEEKGSSVRGVWPSDGIPMMLGPVAILRGAPHRNAAKLFMDFALSREGQVALRDLFSVYSPREDVPPQEGWRSLASLNVMTPTGGWDEYAQRQDTLKPEYTWLFHPESE